MTSTRIAAALALAASTSACTARRAPDAAAAVGPAATSPAISTEDVRRRIEILSDDSTQGRDAGSEGALRAARYLERELRRMGLEPAGDGGSYFQRIPLVVRTPDSASALRVGGSTLSYGTDFVPLPRLGVQLFLGGQPFSGTFAGENVPTVYGGTVGQEGTLAPEAARGKVVVFSTARGANGQPMLAFWQRDNLARYAGAAAVLVTMLDAGNPPALRAPRDYYDDAAKPWPLALPVIGVTSAAAARIFGGTPLASLAVGAAGAPLSGRTGFVDRATAAPALNVVAVLRGRDPRLRGSYVAVGAHYDHVGMSARPFDHDSIRLYNSVVRPRGADDPARPPTPDEVARVRALLDSVRALRPPRPDSVFNGADDDASGTALMLEIAEAFAPAGARPKRSLLFVFHTAEEKGLYGAQYYSDHPTVARDSIVAQINMDQMGRGGPEDVPPLPPNGLVVIGARRLSTELGDLAESLNRRPEHGFALDYAFDRDGDPLNAYCRSDHYMYARYGIPVVFYSGAAYHKDYHMVSDESQYVDHPRTARIGRYVADVVAAVANLDHRPVVDKPKPDPNGGCQQ